ncbi:MAG: hypothetical protein K5865_07445 [Eubacterium sp.]|nr:hypothetical protein [Eubacterium sp.]
MGKIISENIVCITLVTLGVLAWIITIGARISSKRTGHYVSGVPALGGILIIIGFLTSQVKWLALIGLLDFDLWYFVVKIIPDIVRAEKAEKNYIPPKELEGGRVVEYSQHNKEFEEIRYPTEYPGSFEVHRINRYVIIKKEAAYILIKNEHNTRIIERIVCKTLGECEGYASPKVKWISMDALDKS